MNYGKAAGVFLAISSLMACLGGGTDVGNPDISSARITGSIAYREGQKAAWVPVRLRPRTYISRTSDSLPIVSGDSAWNATTDSQGFFVFDSVPKGNYRLESNDGKSRGFVTDLGVDGRSDKITLAVGFLDSTGTISGVVTLGTAPGRTKVWISAYGLERSTLANQSGEYVFGDLPPGNHTLRFSAEPESLGKADVPGIMLTPGGRIRLDTVRLAP